MAKRPTTPRPRSTTRRPAPRPASGRPAAGGSGAGTGRNRPAQEPAPQPATIVPAGPREHVEPEPGNQERGRVVQAGDRFRALVTGRPWRRRRRAILATTAAVVLLIGAALSAAIWLPALQLQQVTVAGLGYVEEDPVRSVVEARTGDSVLLLPATAMEEELAQVPGVRSADVERSWPDGVHVTITEATPVAMVTRPDGSSVIVDGDGAELPEAAGEGATLVPLTVDPASSDPGGATEAMTEVLAALPDPLREAVTGITASSRSDVTMDLSLEDGGSRSVVWGDSRDSELKADVVQALIGQPGTVIDVSSPVAPVTR